MGMFNKKDFKNGMVVELNSGKRRLFWENKFIDKIGFIPLKYYDDNLNHIYEVPKDDNINKIFLTHDIGYFNGFFEDDCLTKIWDRNNLK